LTPSRSGHCQKFPLWRAGLLLIGAVAWACADTYVGVYATLDEARQAGAIARGWVPQGLPSSTTDIREGHDVDTNARWGTFTFPISETARVRALMGEELSTAPYCHPPGRFEWWPLALREPIDVPRLHAAGVRLYRARDGDLTYAINWPTGRAFYWRQ
jgi:hypothetical protein